MLTVETVDRNQLDMRDNSLVRCSVFKSNTSLNGRYLIFLLFLSRPYIRNTTKNVNKQKETNKQK